MQYKVISAICSMDPHPEIREFDDHDEAVDFIYDEVNCRVDYQVEHSPYSITEKEREDMFQEELTLFSLSAID